MIPSSISIDSISRALQHIDRAGVPPARNSVHYDLFVDNKRYPPKYVISIAYFFSSGIEYPSTAFNAVEAKNYFIQQQYIIRDRRLEDGKTQKANDFNDVPPERVETTVYRILRDTELARQVKALHDYKCQICGHTIKLQNGSLYAEAHHIRPLGAPHNGQDIIGNIICVCPNHHAELDYGVIQILSHNLDDSTGHMIDEQYVNYHNQEIYGG